MSLGNPELRSFLKDVGARTFVRYLKTHGAAGEDGLDKSLRWAAWNFRSGARASEATFLMTHQTELRRLLDEGESQWKKRRGKNGSSAPNELGTDGQVSLREPDLAISFDEDEEDEEDAYSFGSAAGFSFRPPGMSEEPEPERDGFMDAARDLVERAALQDSGLTSSLETITIDDDTPEDSKDLMTFGTVAVDAPASPGWVPPSTEEPSLQSSMAPVFMLPPQPLRDESQEKPVFQSQEVYSDVPPVPRELTPISAPNSPNADEEATVLGKPDPLLAAALEQASLTQPLQRPQEQTPSKVPWILGGVATLVLVVAVSVTATLGTLSMTIPEGTVPPPTPSARPVPTTVAPVAQPDLPAVADVDLPDPELVDLELVDPELVDPELVEPEVIEPEPEVIEPEPEVIEPEPEVIEPEPEVIVPEPEPVAPEPEVIVPEPEPVAPEPEVIVPEPEVIVPEPAVVTPEPEPTGLSMVGRWQGTNGAARLILNVTSQSGTTVSGTMTTAGPNGDETTSFSGQLNPTTGDISLSQIGGSASFSGRLSDTQATGTWRAAPGTAARQWFVVKQN